MLSHRVSAWAPGSMSVKHRREKRKRGDNPSISVEFWIKLDSEVRIEENKVLYFRNMPNDQGVSSLLHGYQNTECLNGPRSADWLKKLDLKNRKGNAAERKLYFIFATLNLTFAAYHDMISMFILEMFESETGRMFRLGTLFVLLRHTWVFSGWRVERRKMNEFCVERGERRGGSTGGDGGIGMDATR